MVVAQSGALRSGLFRTFDIGWLEGIHGGCPSGALRSDTFANIRLRVAVGDDGGTERSFAERHLSEHST